MFESAKRALKNFRFKSRTGYAWLLALVALVYILGNGSEFLRAQLHVLAWKLLLVGVAVGLAHLLRKQVFPYIDLSEVLDSDADTKDGFIFLGIAIFYAAIILALTQGL